MTNFDLLNAAVYSADGRGVTANPI